MLLLSYNSPTRIRKQVHQISFLYVLCLSNRVIWSTLYYSWYWYPTPVTFVFVCPYCILINPFFLSTLKHWLTHMFFDCFSSFPKSKVSILLSDDCLYQFSLFLIKTSFSSFDHLNKVLENSNPLCWLTLIGHSSNYTFLDLFLNPKSV